MQIRPADSSDFSTIQQLAHQIWPVAYASILAPEQLHYMLNLFYSPEALSDQVKNGQLFFLLEDEKEAIGFAAIEFNAKPKYTKLHKLYVLSTLQQKGYGAYLMEFCIQQATAAEQTHLYLNVNRYNSAIDFYTKKGFQITATVDVSIGNGYLMEDYVMTRKL